MKTITLIGLLLTFTTANAAEINSVEQAWSYLVNDTKKNQWIIISLHNNKYVQCSNEGDYIRCPFPVNIKITSNPKLIRTVNPRAKPYPDMPDQETTTYLTYQETQKIKRALAKLKLEAVDVHSKVVNENNISIGSAYDLVVTLETDYKNFNVFINLIFVDVWGKSENQDYNYETDS